MFHEIYEFANKGIYTFEEILEKDLSLSGDTNIEEPNKKHLKLELSGDYIGTFCYLLKNQSINQEIVATIYDEEYICNEYTNKQRKQLIKKLNTLPIKQIRFILSNETLPIYNELMLKENWQHKNKTTITMTLDYEPKNQEIRVWNLKDACGKLEIPSEKLVWVPDYELQRINDRIDKDVLEETFLLKIMIEKLFKYLEINYNIEQMNEFEKTILLYQILKEERKNSVIGIDKIDGKLTLIKQYPEYISKIYELLDSNLDIARKAKIVATLLNNPFMKVNATTIHGKLNQQNNSWIGTEIDSSFYQSSLLMDLPFQNLEEMGYVIDQSESNRQIYPSIYTHEYLTEPEIKKIQKHIKSLKRK